MMRIMARWMKATTERTWRSKSRASRRQRTIQAKVRSTIQRFGSTSKRGTLLLQPPGAGLRHHGSHLWSLVAAVGVDHLDERKQPACPAQQCGRAIEVRHVAGMHDEAQHQAERIDQDVPLAAGELLARVEALRIDRRPPFCAALALWLSMMAALGLASRPARSRTAT